MKNDQKNMYIPEINIKIKQNGKNDILCVNNYISIVLYNSSRHRQSVRLI